MPEEDRAPQITCTETFVKLVHAVLEMHAVGHADHAEIETVIYSTHSLQYSATTTGAK